ncbi:TPA: hydrolase [Streptococcus suis]
MIYFIADTHFYHKNVIAFCNRPFSTVEEMNQALITNWNKTVSDIDEVYIVYKGNGKQANELLQSLNSKKYLLKGNHEHYLNSPDFDITLFEWVKDYHTLIYNKRKFVLFHYPILEWENYHHDSIHIYGHVHNNQVEYFSKILGKNAFNVGLI